MGSYRSFELPESRVHYPRQRDIQTKHVRIELKIDFEKKSIQGNCTLRFVVLREGMRTFSLDGCGMAVSAVFLDGVDCQYEYDNERVRILSLGALAGEHTVRVDYSSAPRAGVHFTGPDEEHPEKEVQAWSHNEAEYARHWFPCFDDMRDKCSSEVIATVPAGFIVVSNGELLSVRQEEGWSTFHWKEDLPHSSYLTSFVAGRFGEIKQESEGVPLHYYFPERKRTDALRYFGETPRMITVFNQLTGVKYPYRKYSQATVEDFIYGGMENFNATTLAMNYYPDASSEEDFQASYAAPHTNAVNLVAHELAHMWFGDLVTCSDWSHAWLNEGFATYFQGMYLEMTRGVDDFRWDMSMRAEQYFEEDKSEYRRPIVEKNYIEPDDVFDYTTYEKGEWMIHELRYVMGDKLFLAGIKEYLSRHSYRNAETDDLRRAMEDVSGYSLQKFFDQSFMKPGFPEFEASYEWDDDSRTATLRVKQVQRLEQGTPLFTIPCDVVFYVSGARVKKRIGLEGPAQTFAFELSSKPTIVELDPERWILSKISFKKPLELLVNQLKSSQDASSRSDAARTLGERGSNSAIGNLKEAALREQFWDVRASAIRALGKIGSSEALKALLEIGIPKDRRVRRGLAEAFGNFKDESARMVIIQLLQGDESPYVRCEAALSLAKSWPQGALGLLKEAMTFHTPNETLAEACMEAMGKLKDGEVAAIIQENLRYGKPTRARIGALKAIKGRGQILDAELALLKRILLEDKELRVRQYLTASLVPEIGDRRMLDSLKESSEKDKDPRIRRKALEAYHKISQAAESSNAIGRLREEVEKLKERNLELAKDRDAVGP